MLIDEILSLQNTLGIEDRNALTETLFDISWVEGKHGDGEDWVHAFDENGDLLTQKEEEMLSTLGGIIKFACEKAREDERKKIRKGLKTLIGV